MNYIASAFPGSAQLERSDTQQQNSIILDQQRMVIFECPGVNSGVEKNKILDQQSDDKPAPEASQDGQKQIDNGSILEGTELSGI